MLTQNKKFKVKNPYKGSLFKQTEYMKHISENIIGKHMLIKTPFGMKPLVYCDYTASGWSLRCVEEYITNNVLPLYANTHTLTSWTAKQTTFAWNEAWSIIKSVTGCDE